MNDFKSLKGSTWCIMAYDNYIPGYNSHITVVYPEKVAGVLMSGRACANMATKGVWGHSGNFIFRDFF